MDFLQTPQSIYETLTAKAENVWVTVYPDPGGKNNCLFAGEGDPSEQWHLVESIIRNAAGRYNRFQIRVALGSKNAFPQTIPVQVAGVGAPAQVAGIGSMPGYGGVADIGAIKREMKEEFAEQMKRERELWEMQSQIAGLSQELQQKKRKSGDVMDKIEGFAQTTGLDLSNPQSIQAVSGLLMGALDKVLGVFTARQQQAYPAMGNAPQQGRTHIHRSEATAAVPDSDGTEVETDELEPGDDYTELTEQETMALEALELLAQAGASNPGELLKKVAQFYANDPVKAEGFLKFL